MNPMFQSQQRASGSYGNTGLAEAQTRQAASTLGNIATNARMGDYSTQQKLTQDLGMYNAGNMQSQNQFNANLAQTNMNNSLQQYNQAQNMVSNAAFNTPQYNTANMNNYGTLFNAANTMNSAQWMPLQNYANIVNGGSAGSQQTQPSTSSNGVMTTLGALGIGSNIYSNLFGWK